MPLRLGHAGTKALGLRRASSRACLGTRGAQALSVTVSACNQALQATQSHRVLACLIAGDSLLCLVLSLASGRLSLAVTRRLSGRELGAEALDGVLFRLSRAGSTALGPRRASFLAGLGARGSGAVSGGVGACNHSLQATQSRRAWRLSLLLATRCLAWCCHGLRAA